MSIDTADEPRQRSQAEAAVTRAEVVAHLAAAFPGGMVGKAELLGEAERTGAPRGVLDLLRRLPERRFYRPHDLWAELPDVPIEG